MSHDDEHAGDLTALPGGFLLVEIPALVRVSRTAEDVNRLQLVNLASGWSCDATGEVAEAALGILRGAEASGRHRRLLDALGPRSELALALSALADGGAGQRLELTPRNALSLGGFGTLFVELTSACNERCLHCYAGAGPQRRRGLDRLTCEALVDDGAALGFQRLQFTGGDPLLCPFLPDLVARAADLGVGEREIFTNGIALSAQLLARLRPSRPSFALSVYSHDPAVHDAITATEGSHRRTIAALQRVLAAGLAVRAAMVVMAQNASHVAATVSFLERLGVEHVGVSPSHEVGRGGRFERSVDPPASGVSCADVSSTEPPREPTPGDPRLPPQQPRGKLCVTFDGEVVPCIFNREMVLGRLDQRRLRDIARAPEIACPPLDRGTGISALLKQLAQQLECPSCRLTALALRGCAQSAAGEAASG